MDGTIIAEQPKGPLLQKAEAFKGGFYERENGEWIWVFPKASWGSVLGMRHGTTPINHPLWFPFRGPLGSFLHSLSHRQETRCPKEMGWSKEATLAMESPSRIGHGPATGS